MAVGFNDAPRSESKRVSRPSRRENGVEVWKREGPFGINRFRMRRAAVRSAARNTGVSQLLSETGDCSYEKVSFYRPAGHGDGYESRFLGRGFVGRLRGGQGSRCPREWTRTPSGRPMATTGSPSSKRTGSGAYNKPRGTMTPKTLTRARSIRPTQAIGQALSPAMGWFLRPPYMWIDKAWRWNFRPTCRKI